MSFFDPHQAADPDPYKRPAFGVGNRNLRLLWQLVWLFGFRFSPRPFFKWRCFLLGLFGAKIGASNFIYPSAKVWAPWLLVTGDVVTIADGVEIYNPATVTLGHHSILSQGSFICTASHDYNDPNFPMIWRPISVGAYGWICARAVVLPGVSVGQGAVLGAAGVTSRDLQAWAIYAGNPAVKVADRKQQMSY